MAVEHHCFVWNRRVEFSETDAAGIAHFSSLLIYMEQAEHALLRSVGQSVFPRESPNDTAHITWPRVRIETEFAAPAYFEDELTIIVQIEKLGTKSIVYRHTIRRDNVAIATGKFTNVCCTRTGHGLKSTEIPEHLRDALAPFLVVEVVKLPEVP